MTLTLNELLKDSAYKLSQFSATQIQALESGISIKEIRGKATPYVVCLVRNKEIKLTPEEAVRQLYLQVLLQNFAYPVTRLTVGRSACYLHEQNALPDNHVTILRTDKINPIFLSVYLNSIAGKYQVDKYFKGSSGQIELYPKDIENFYIPVIDEDTQTQIANLVQQSFTLKAESERLLAAAKRAVEIAIEESETVAVEYLNKEKSQCH